MGKPPRSATPAGSCGNSLPPARPWLPCLRRCFASAAARRTGGRGEGTAGGTGGEGLVAQPAQPTEYRAGMKHTHTRKLFKNEMNTEVTPPPTPPGSPLLQTKAGPRAVEHGERAQRLPAAVGGSRAG